MFGISEPKYDPNFSKPAHMFIPVKLSNPFRGNVTNPFRTKLYTR